MTDTTPTKAVRIVASMRDQALDVNLGLLTPSEWVKRYDTAVEQGVEFPAALADFRARLLS